MKLKYFLVLITSFFFMNVVYANDIKSISMDIYVDNNGNAHIKETWVADLNSGTEGYKPYYNLGTSEIKDFKVKLGDREFITISYWNVDASFNNKSYKAGIHKIEDGYELCFGISKYGLNTYELNYTITNFVVGLNDSDMIYWTLVPHNLSDKPESVHIKIYSDFKYEDTLDVWGYGNYGGLAYVHDGYIEMDSEGELETYEYMTILVKYPKDTFNTNTKIDKEFNYYYEMAEDGAEHYIEPDDNIDEDDDIIDVDDDIPEEDEEDIKESKSVSNIFRLLVVIIFLAFPILVAIILLSLNKGVFYGTKKLKFSKEIKKVKDAPYFRDIPCNKNIFEAYWIACQFGLVNSKNDFLGAVLLKWIKDKNIEKVVKDKYVLKFNNKKNLTDVEIELYDMMEESSIDGILEKNEFVKWCRKHSSMILNWFNKIIDEQTMNYVSSGLIYEEKALFNKKYLVNSAMKEYALQMSGLKKFLNDFSNIKDRKSIEVMLWQEYLMYAQIFGIAKEVAREFKNLYPDVITEEAYSDFIFIDNLSYEIIEAASHINSSSSSSSYSSGGGGFSSGSGGSGSFGGGSSGGGGFR